MDSEGWRGVVEAVLRGLLVLTSAVWIGCGDSDPGYDDVLHFDGGPGDAPPIDSGTGPTDAGTEPVDSAVRPDLRPSGSLVDFGQGFTGTTTLSYSFLDEITYDFHLPPDPYFDAVSLAPSSDLMEVVVESTDCTLTGVFREVDPEDGDQIYDVDFARSSCELWVNGHQVDYTLESGGMNWGSHGLFFFVSGTGNIPNSESIVLVEFRSE